MSQFANDKDHCRITQLPNCRIKNGGLAQLARASALHAEGHRFDSDILHRKLANEAMRQLANLPMRQ
jgi:hypothetical protein